MDLNFKKEAVVLLQASFLFNFASGFFLPFYALFVQRVGGSILDTGIAYAIFSIATGLMIIIFCRSRFYLGNVRRIIVAGYFAIGIIYLFYLLVGSRLSLFSVQAVLGIAIGLSAPAWDAVFGSDLSEKAAGKQWSVWTGAVNIALGLGALIGGLIVGTYSFAVLFLMMAGINFLAGIVSWRIIRF